MSTNYTKPLPTIYPWTEPFWKGAHQGKLLIQKGKKTGKLIMYPKKYSPYDASEELEWIEACGKGTIYSFSTVYNNPPKVFAGDVPFTVAVVELEEGVRMCSNIVDADPEKIRIGAPVKAVFKPVTDSIGLVQFKLA